MSELVAPVAESVQVVVTRKDIKNMYLRVDLNTGEVRVSAPRRVSSAEIERFVEAKREWIARRRKRALERHQAPMAYRTGEQHLLWGASYRLEVEERPAAPRVQVRDDAIELGIRPGADSAERREVLESWYRDHVRHAAWPMIDRWERAMGVKVKRLFVRRMKTMWGSCNYVAGSIRLNTELARKPPECFEYVIVHELAHLIEPSHDARFWGLMDRFMPDWRPRRDLLNREASGPSTP